LAASDAAYFSTTLDSTASTARVGLLFKKASGRQPVQDPNLKAARDFNCARGGDMQFDKQEIVDLLRKEGKNEHVQKAVQELPDKIDHERHAHLLQEKFGIDPGKLVQKAAEKELGTSAASAKPSA
jgi:hypothetical protein